MTDWFEYPDARPRQETLYRRAEGPAEHVKPMYTDQQRSIMPWLELMGADSGSEDPELRDVILAAFDALPDQERFVVEAHLFEGLSFSQLGERLGNSVGEVREDGSMRPLPKQMVERIYARALGRMRAALADTEVVLRHLTGSD